MTTVIILIILACALPETSASIVSASRPCPLAVTVTQVLRRDVDGVGGDELCDCDPGAAQ